MIVAIANKLDINSKYLTTIKLSGFQVWIRFWAKRFKCPLNYFGYTVEFFPIYSAPHRQNAQVGEKLHPLRGTSLSLEGICCGMNFLFHFSFLFHQTNFPTAVSQHPQHVRTLAYDKSLQTVTYWKTDGCYKRSEESLYMT